MVQPQKSRIDDANGPTASHPTRSPPTTSMTVSCRSSGPRNADATAKDASPTQSTHRIATDGATSATTNPSCSGPTRYPTQAFGWPCAATIALRLSATADNPTATARSQAKAPGSRCRHHPTAQAAKGSNAAQ